LKLQFEKSEMNRFGRRMARLRITAGDAAVTVAGILGSCRAERVEMLTLRIPTGRLGLVQELEEHEFRLMDCLVYYEAGTGSIPRAEPHGYTLREASGADVEQVCDLARICFTDYYSHYHADPRLDRGLVAEGYVDWARRSCTDRSVAATVLLLVVGERIAGFATMRQNSEAEGEGVLFGVDPEFSERGIYGALIDRGMRWCSENGMKRMIVSTQLDNLRVQRSWSNRGFRLSESFFTFHRWFI
jgi:GNAT superfamily N-acetyltransferase